MGSWILRILNIRKEEQKSVYILMLFSFFIGLSLTFYFTAANAIFLKHFAPGMISLSYILSGIMVYVAWWLLSRLDRRLTLPRQILVKIMFVFISVVIIGTGVWLYDSPWLAFVLFTWIRVMVYITVITFWGLAGRLFNIRQGKRIFGLIGIGEVLSIIIGYFSVPLILQLLKTADLLFLASVSLLACIILVLVILRRFAAQLSSPISPPRNEGIPKKSEWNYWRLLRQPYFFLISAMAILPIFGYLTVDFLFLAQTKSEFSNNTETIARFLGIFLGFTAVVELGFKLVSGRFLNKYGLRPSLVALPSVLIFSIALATFFGFLYGDLGLFFAFIALSRLFERAVRGSIYEPAFQLLYQPVPEDKRLIFQNQIEGIPKALGTVVTGAVIFGLSSIPAFNPSHFNLFFLIILALWIWLGFKMYEAYRSFIKQKLAIMPVLSDRKDHTAIQEMQERLCRTNAATFPGVFGVYHYLSPVQAEKAAGYCFLHAPEQLRQTTLEYIRHEKLVTCREMLIAVRNTNPGSILADTLNATINELTEVAMISPEKWGAMAHHPDPAIRTKTARLLGTSNRFLSYRIIHTLLKDPVPAVRRAAVISAGRMHRQELWPAVIEQLKSAEMATAAFIALKMGGDAVVDEVEREFEKLADHRLARIRIIRLFEATGGDRAIKYLRSKINHSDHEVRTQVLQSLCNLEYRTSASESPYIRQTIEEVIRSIVWIMACLTGIGNTPDCTILQESLLQEMEERKELFFLLLSLLYESQTIRHIRESIESQDRKARIYALEICDMTVSDEIKELFFPLFEDITIYEKLQRFRYRFPQEKLSVADRIRSIVQQKSSWVNPWTRACALDILGRLHDPDGMDTERILAANMLHPEKVVSEVAGRALMMKNPGYYQKTLQIYSRHMPYEPPSAYRLIFDLQKTIKEIPWLAPVSDHQLLPLATRLQQYPGEDIPKELILDFVAGNPILTGRYLDHLMKEKS